MAASIAERTPSIDEDTPEVESDIKQAPLYKCEWAFMLHSDKDYDATKFNVPNLIVEGLYHGDAFDAKKPKLLWALDIKAMIGALGESKWNPAHDTGMKILHVNIKDNPKDPANALEPHVDAICKFFDENRKLGNKILSFCMMGISRSSSVNIIILMYLSAWKLNPVDALEYLRSRRSCCKPAPGFMVELEEIRQKRLKK
ncbi:MAG: hypothetical protein Harvfovirus3_70 [Harvfovirus sp.]|uniref:Uncharacterized protein n=1 Tax=Harvfovirus sp. TaxID=2487768 RepID=A0A3G5A0B3_9VIRU|nr:MAG: hypothetical protein Harvfovirus3_70 [Harvfovirus sp.]